MPPKLANKPPLDVAAPARAVPNLPAMPPQSINFNPAPPTTDVNFDTPAPVVTAVEPTEPSPPTSLLINGIPCFIPVPSPDMIGLSLP